MNKNITWIGKNAFEKPLAQSMMLGRNFCFELDRRISAINGDARELSFLLQRISIAIQSCVVLGLLCRYLGGHI